MKPLKKTCTNLSVLGCTDVEAVVNNSFVATEEEIEDITPS
jgi:hypothetical protein